MNKELLIQAARLLKMNCIYTDCKNCYFNAKTHCSILELPQSWRIDLMDDVKGSLSVDENGRLADLHREIDIRDRKIDELERTILGMRSIINKQGVMLAEKQEEIN